MRLQKFFFFRGEIKIICSLLHTKQSTKKQNKKTKKIFLLQSRLWMGGTVAESGALLNFVFVVCSSSSLLYTGCARLEVDGVSVVPCSSVSCYVIKTPSLSLFSLSLSLSLNSLLSFYFSFFRTLFLSLSLLFSPPLFVAGQDPPRTSSEQKRARKTLSLSLSLSFVKNKKLQSVLHRGDGFGVQSFDFL